MNADSFLTLAINCERAAICRFVLQNRLEVFAGLAGGTLLHQSVDRLKESLTATLFRIVDEHTDEAKVTRRHSDDE